MHSENEDMATATVPTNQQEQKPDRQPQPPRERSPEERLLQDILDRTMQQQQSMDPLAVMFDPSRGRILMKFADEISKSDMLPDQFRGNYANCLIAVQLAMRMKVDPFMLMQNMYIVHGKPGMEAKLAIGMLNASGKIKGTIKYKLTGEGDSRACVATVVDADTGEIVDGPPVTWDMAVKEGWTTKKGSKWLTIADLMFRYRAAVFLIRAHYPEVMMGLQTKDELDDVDDEPSMTQRMAGLADAAGVEAPRDQSSLIAEQLRQRRQGTADEHQPDDRRTYVAPERQQEPETTDQPSEELEASQDPPLAAENESQESLADQLRREIRDCSTFDAALKLQSLVMSRKKQLGEDHAELTTLAKEKARDLKAGK